MHATRSLLFTLLLSVPASTALGHEQWADDGGGADDISPAALLYSTRIQFQGDEPMVTVALVEGEPRITFRPGDGVRVRLGGPEAKELFLPPRGTYEISCADCRKGEVSYRPVVADIEYGAPELRRQVAAQWMARNIEIEFVQVGGLFGLRGKVIDTRRYLGVAGGYTDEMAATARSERLSELYGTKVFVYKELQRFPQGTLAVRELREGGRAKILGKARDLVTLRPASGDGEIVLDHVPHDQGFSDGARATRSYRGQVYVTVGTDGGLTAINLVSLESLLKGLVPSEIFASAPMDALRAQSVVARGEVLAKVGVHHVSDPYLLCSSQHCQVYSGRNKEHPRANQAVDDTRGEVLVGEAERIVSSVYSSTCGGHTEDNDIVWPMQPDTHLRGHADDHARTTIPERLNETNMRGFIEGPPTGWCARSTFVRKNKLRWTREFQARDLDALVNKRHRVGRVKKLVIEGRGPGGRVRAVTVIGTKGEFTVHRELPVRRLFGNLNSGAFVVDVERDAQGQPRRFIFKGAGWGHGVGMCQMGAIGMAEHRHSYDEILRHYYRGSRLLEIY